MNSYQKKWGTVFGFLVLVITSLLIYSGATSDKLGSILQTINLLDSEKIRDILIAPENPDWKINLTIDTLTVDDNNEVNDIVFALRTLKGKHLTKGAKIFWESTLIINLDKPNAFNLKDNAKLTFKIMNTEEGLFIEMTNKMGYETYACQPLKPILEKLTHYQNPLSGKN